MKIRFSRPVIVGRELDYVRQALEQGHLSSHGAFTRRCEAWLAARLNVPRAHLTNSATAGLELSALLAELRSGDEVVMPAFTFVSCANAVALRGAIPVFADIRPDQSRARSSRRRRSCVGGSTVAMLPVFMEA